MNKRFEGAANAHVFKVWYEPELYREMSLGEYPKFMEEIFLAGAQYGYTEGRRDMNEECVELFERAPSRENYHLPGAIRSLIADEERNDG